jgi:hypothetical protein
MEMVVEMQRFPCPQTKWILDLWVTLSSMSLCLWRLCYDVDFGPFMKVVSSGSTSTNGRRTF